MASQSHAELTPVELSSFLHLGISDVQVAGSVHTFVTGITLDSREVFPGNLFAAITGHNSHGLLFMDEAIKRGAAAILTDTAGWNMIKSEPALELPIPVLVIPDARKRMGEVANLIYGGAADKLCLIGVTGTNGKTTTTTMIQAALIAAGRSAGFIGTTGVRIGLAALNSSRTTPEATALHQLFAQMSGVGVSDVVMEVSSHAMSEHRVGGMQFEVVGFTNLSQDHLDYHHTMEEYFKAKSSLFRRDYARQGVVCIDSSWGERLVAEADIPIATVTAMGKQADWSIELTSLTNAKIVGPMGEQAEVQLQLPGEFNRANAVLAYAMLRAIQIPNEAIALALSTVQVDGRLEKIQGSNGAAGIEGFVDYAHTPDAVQRVLTAVRELTVGRVIAVIGAGGDRDVTKRPLMGEIAAHLADQLIVTDDNPRSEDPALIRADILAGVDARSMMRSESILEVADRSLAIATAVKLARSGDVVVVLGKGHEQGQEISGVITPFDDRVVLRLALEEINAGVK